MIVRLKRQLEEANKKIAELEERVKYLENDKLPTSKPQSGDSQPAGKLQSEVSE